MSTPINRLIKYFEETGETGLLPDGGIINAGGVAGPKFTVGGKGVIFTDGTGSDGSGQIIAVGSNAVAGYEHTQDVESKIWVIPHARNSKRIQVTIWDQTDEMVLADSVKIVDLNTVEIGFNTAITGRAILMIFPADS
jgi:hypothetical protein